MLITTKKTADMLHKYYRIKKPVTLIDISRGTSYMKYIKRRNSEGKITLYDKNNRKIPDFDYSNGLVNYVNFRQSVRPVRYKFTVN
jgi:hypothetical protein